MPGLSIETSVMPFLRATAFTCAAPSAPLAGNERALEIRRLRREHVERDVVLAGGQDAARVQHLRAVARDFLRFVVVERLEHARRRRGARVRAEHAGHVRPDFEAGGVQLGGEIGGGGIRATTTEQHGVAVLIARNEALGDDDRRELREALLHGLVRSEIAGRGEQARLRRSALALFGLEQRAGIRPLHVDALAGEEPAAQLGGHELTVGHEARARVLSLTSPTSATPAAI